MNQRRSVREARVELALALLNDPVRQEQAAAELRQALHESGDDPPDWAIHLRLGQLAANSQGDRVDALTELITATLGAPQDHRAEAAKAALALLADSKAHLLTSRLDAKVVQSLRHLAEEPGADLESVRLAAQVFFLRGEAETVGSLISSKADPRIDADPTLRTASDVAYSLRLIEEGKSADALTVTGHEPSADPSIAFTRALAFYGLNRLDDAAEALAGTTATFEIAAASALISLRRAAATTGDEHSMAVREADRAAGEAARLESSPGGGLLLRAQVALEATLDIEDGRRLLKTAIRRLDGDPDHSLHWRLQRQMRDDDVFRYMKLEVAAAQRDNDQLLTITAGDLPFRTTHYRQDAEIASLIAEAMLTVDRSEQAATFFAAAKEYYDHADQPDLALQALRSVEEVRPTIDSSLELAERYWQASFRVGGPGLDEATDLVLQGLRVLDDLDGRSPDLERSKRAHGAYLRGLLLAAKSGATSGSRRDRWLALPWLLVAALEDRMNSYRAAHLALALSASCLQRAALHFANRALLIDPADGWIREVAVIMRFNWYGVLDADTDNLLADRDESLANSVRTYDALMRDDLTRLREMVGSINLDAMWARGLRAAAMSRLEGISASMPLYRALLEETRKDGADHAVARDAALVLHELDEARKHNDAGIADGTIGEADGRLNMLLIELLSGAEGVGDALLALVQARQHPFSLRELAQAVVPVLVEAWPDLDSAPSVLQEVRLAAISRTSELQPDMLPPMTAQFDEPGEGSSDPALDEFVRDLLRIEELCEKDPATATQALQRMATENADTPIGLALAAAASAGPPV